MSKRGRKPTNPAGVSWTEELYNSRTDATLSEASKVFRDAFVREYIKDFNGAAALCRCSVSQNPAYAKQRAWQLLQEPYVANRIDTLVRQLQPTDIVTRGQVMARMWDEANNASDCHSRVAALAHLSKMLGMDKPKGEDEGTSTPVGVMMIPVMHPNDWEVGAQTAQAMLKAAVTTPRTPVSPAAPFAGQN